VLAIGLLVLGIERQTASLATGAFVWEQCLVALRNPRHRALHDVVAGSALIRRELAAREAGPAHQGS
jgi:hypothetical protein